MPISPTLEPKLLERAKQLKLMGFRKDEVRPVLEAEHGISLTLPEYEELWKKLLAALGQMPEVSDVKQEIGQAWERSKLIQSDLLAVYQLLVRNFNAYMDGQTEIVDPVTGDVRPVIPVRANDLISVADKVLKIDQERVTSMLNSLKVIPALEAPPEEPTPALPGHSMLATLIDEEDDPDDEEEAEEPLDADFQASQ